MTLIIGPQLDVVLQTVKNDLKGKTQLDKPYVCNETLLHAVRQQNDILHLMQTTIYSHVNKLHSIESAMEHQSKEIMTLKEKLKGLQRYTEKVDSMGTTMNSWKKKIELIDQLEKCVEHHQVSIDKVNNDMNHHSSKISSLKEETHKSIAELEDETASLSDRLNGMPNTIKIKTHQIKHGIAKDNKNNLILADILKDNDKRSDLLENKTNHIENTLQYHAIVVSKVEDKIEEDLSKVGEDLDLIVQWKKEQSLVDLTGIQRSQDSIDLSLQSIQHDLLNKSSRKEVEKKLDNKFNDFIDHLQTALTSVEKDEADFKAVTTTLNKMCTQLKEKKADKEDISNLRKQFIEKQIEAKMPPIESSMDNEEIRNLNKVNFKYHALENLLDGKADKNVTIYRINQIEAAVKSIQHVIKRLITDVVVDKNKIEPNRSRNGLSVSKENLSASNTFKDADQISQVSFVSLKEEFLERKRILCVEPINDKYTNKTCESKCHKSIEDEETSDAIVKDVSIDSSDMNKLVNKSVQKKKVSLKENGRNSWGKAQKINEEIKRSINKVESFPELIIGTNKNMRNTYPTVKKGAENVNPRLSLGGGFQLNHQTKKGKDPLRSLDQYKAQLPIFEKKKMVSGDDGTLYIRSRQGEWT